MMGRKDQRQESTLETLALALLIEHTQSPLQLPSQLHMLSRSLFKKELFVLAAGNTLSIHELLAPSGMI